MHNIYTHEIGDTIDWYGEHCTIIKIGCDVLTLERPTGETVQICNPHVALPIIKKGTKTYG